ncbi:MAG: thiol reductant ABC exporter subunit CydC [Luteibacter sp.]
MTHPPAPWPRLFALLREQRPRMLGGAAAALLSTVAGIALVAVSGHFITSMALAGAGGLAINYYTPAALVRLFAILRTLGRYVERVVTHDATLRILARLRTWLFARLVPLAPAALGTLGSAELYSRVRADIDTLEQAYLGVFTPALVALLACGGVLLVTVAYSPALALVLLLLYPLGGVVLPMWVQARGRHPAGRADELAESMRWQHADGLRGRAELALFGAEEAFAQRLAATMAGRQASLRRLQELQARADACMVVLMQVAGAAALAIGIPALRSGALEAGELTMLVLMAMAGFDAIAPLPAAWAKLGGVRAAAQRVFELADRESPVVEPAGAHAQAAPGRVDLHLRHVWLRHGEPGRWALRGVDLDIPEGRHIAIVGPSGSGKTSLVQALCRLRPYQGRITLGGVSIDAMRGDDVRACFAVVEQKPYLFGGTLRDNLHIARADASDENMRDALHDARLDDFLAGLPLGLDTWIGENGTGVSGGEARRIAIARALLSAAPVLVLDEPTEGLDAETARALYASLAVRTRGRTVVLITHRLGALDDLVDEIVPLVEGAIRPGWSAPPARWSRR